MGFFSTEYKSKKKGKFDFDADLIKKHGCKLCPLRRGPNNPSMPATGSEHPDIYIIGEAPGEKEDNYNSEDFPNGRQFVGTSGKFLRSKLYEIFGKNYEGITRFNNTIRCRPPENRDPKDHELEFCRNSIEEDIKRTKPKIIIGAGKFPLWWILKKKEPLVLYRGRSFPVKILGHVCRFFSVYHPAFIVRNLGQSSSYDFDVYEHIFNLDFEKIKNISWDAPYFPDKGEIFKDIFMENDWNRLALYLRVPEISIDIETSTLRPYEKDARILSFAVSNGETTDSFLIENEKDMEKLGEFLSNSRTKIVHNLPFELEWFNYFFGEGLIFDNEWEDTQALAYVLDERKDKAKGKGAASTDDTGRGLLALNDLTFLYYGFHLKEYSPIFYKDITKNSKEDLKKGNNLDAKWTYRLYEDMWKVFEEEGTPREIYYHHIDTAKSIALMQKKGVSVNWSKIKELEGKYKIKKEKTEIEIKRDKDVQKHIKIYGEFNPDSSHHLVRVLKEYKGIPAKKGTKEKKIEDGGYSTDEEVMTQLEKEGVPLARNIIDFRRWRGLLSKYSEDSISGWVMPDGRIHTNYNSTLARTGRLSSDNPPMQTFHKKKGKEPRSIIIAEPGCWIASPDFKALEAVLIANSSKDPNFVEQVKNGYDTHYEWAKILAQEYPRVIGGKRFINDKEVMKKFRSRVKNEFVFPKFYGAGDKKCSILLEIPIEIVARVSRRLWREFPRIKKWQEEVSQFYKEHGYVVTEMGRRRHGPLSYTRQINSPIQGLAADLVKEAMNRLARLSVILKKSWLLMNLNVHDELVCCDIPDNCLEDATEMIAKEMVRPLDFLKIPLVIDMSIGKNWCDLVKTGSYSTYDFYKQAA